MSATDPLGLPPYGLDRFAKRAFLEHELRSLTLHHASRCESYCQLLAARGIDPSAPFTLETVPFLPVRLFKEHDLLSIERTQVFRTLTSSGTTGQAPSRVYLDKQTALRQTSALIRIMQDFIGRDRLPMLIVDHAGVVKDRASFSARGAGILGMANFGRDHTYALRDDMSLDAEAVRIFCRKHRGRPTLVFGFTFMVWQHFVRVLESAAGGVELAGAILVHSGGWKHLLDQAVTNEVFKERVRQVTGIDRVHNFYGMVEQVGSIFVECQHGYLHSPAFADVVVRDPLHWHALKPGMQGIIQVVSCLPKSYPGHSLLTEDLGTVMGEDGCPCGRLGRYFSIAGRIPKAEARGCSDTQPAIAGGAAS